jgi:hypothetical protein
VGVSGCFTTAGALPRFAIVLATFLAFAILDYPALLPNKHSIAWPTNFSNHQE